MLRRIIIAFVAFFVVLGILAVVAAIKLRPPAPLRTLQQQNLVLSGVTLVNPGLTRAAGQTIIIRGSRITAVTSQPPERSEASMVLSRYRVTTYCQGS